jgi:hypothetical protein
MDAVVDEQVLDERLAALEAARLEPARDLQVGEPHSIGR